MSAHPELEDLESVAQGRPAPEAERHVAECAECARELAWLRAERALIARRPSPPVDGLWAGIEARIGRPQQAGPRLRRPHWARRAAVAVSGAAAAAALVLLVMRTRPAPVQAPAPVAQRESDFHPDPKTLAALDRAEADYRDAANVLEAEYQRLRPRLDPALASRWDETLTRARTQLGEARAVAAEDVNARMQVLDGYAGYVRSLRNAVQNLEEANP